jgi:hypothetical protein
VYKSNNSTLSSGLYSLIIIISLVLILVFIVQGIRVGEHIQSDSPAYAQTTPPSGGKYNYAPYATLSGSNYTDVPSSSSLQLTTSMTVASWFRTTTNHADTSFIVNKGGHGSETPGQNIN